MIEPEMAFTDHEESLQVQEQFISHVVQSVVKTAARSLKRSVAIFRSWRRSRHHSRGLRTMRPLNSCIRKISIFLGVRILARHETAIAEKYDKPVFITHYPAGIKAFYMKPDPNRPEVVLCADMIAPEGYGEIIGGSRGSTIR